MNGGSGTRMITEYRMGDYDIAGKTGTTQNAADTWFMMAHPDLVIGSWVGFNDPSFRFRSEYWGQGAHTSLHVVGSFMTLLTGENETFISKNSRFPTPSRFTVDQQNAGPADSLKADESRRGRLDW